MKVAGIDPGANGAICVLDSLDPAYVALLDLKGKSTYEIYNWVLTESLSRVWVEDVHSLHGMSAKSNFSFGSNVGMIHAVATIALSGGIIDTVTPKIWQKYVGVTAKGKEIKNQVAALATGLYPSVNLYGPKGGLRDGRSDALMICYYGLQHSKGLTMKIEINIDIEAIVKEAITDILREQLVINNVPGTKPTATWTTPGEEATSTPPTPRTTLGVDWEYAPKSGKRRGKEDQALHELEKKLGRRLTPEEKGQTRGLTQVAEDTEEKAKEDTINKVRINKLAEEGIEAATKELAEEEKNEATAPVTTFVNGVEQIPTVPPVEPEAAVPETAPLNINPSLFG